MKLLLKRKAKNSTATISQLYVNGKFECFVLEDLDRMLTDAMLLADILKTKVKGKTAIPTGTYPVVVTWSPRFKKNLPRLQNVKGFEGILIHPGNSSIDTDGCLLTGSWNGINKDWITQSRLAFNALFTKIQLAISNKEKVTIEIIREYD